MCSSRRKKTKNKNMHEKKNKIKMKLKETKNKDEIIGIEEIKFNKLPSLRILSH